MNSEHKSAPGFVRVRQDDGPLNGHDINKPLQGPGLGFWPYDFTATRPTLVSPHEILKAERPKVTTRQRIRAALLFAAGFLYTLLFALSVWGLVSFFAGKAHAAEPVWLVANVGSYHPDREYAREHDLTGVNPGLGAEYAVRDDARLVGGAYRNSYRKTSLYAAAAWQPIEILGARVGVLGGLINGYPMHEGRFGPFAALVASVELQRIGFNVVALPKVRDKAHGAIALQVKWRL